MSKEFDGQKVLANVAGAVVLGSKLGEKMKAAGITAAKTIRSLSPDAQILVISEDEQVHSRCMLHKVISHERDAAGISFVPQDFFEANRIQWMPGTRVKYVWPVTSKVQLENDETLRISEDALKRSVAFTEVMLVRTYKSFWTEWVSLCDSLEELENDLQEFFAFLTKRKEE